MHGQRNENHAEVIYRQVTLCVNVRLAITEYTSLTQWPICVESVHPLKVETASVSETSEHIHYTARGRTPENHHLGNTFRAELESSTTS